MDIVKSVNDVPIRLTYERWVHIIENHDDMATTEIAKTLKEITELVPHFIKLPEARMWIDYDKAADVHNKKTRSYNMSMTRCKDTKFVIVYYKNCRYFYVKRR